MSGIRYILCMIFLWNTIVAYSDKDPNILKLKEYRYTRHLDSSVYYFKKAVPEALQNKDSLQVFYLHKFLGDAYEHHQRIDSTLKLYDICWKYIPAGNFKLKSFLLNDKAYTYRLLYDYDKSAELVLQAMKYAERSGDKREIANCMLSVASGFEKMKMNKIAEFYFLKSIGISEEVNDTAMLSYSYRYYADYLLAQASYKEAKVNLDKAFALSALLKDSISMAYVWSDLTDYYWNVGNPDSSLYCAGRAEKIWERRMEYIDLAAVCLKAGTYYMELADYRNAELYMKKAEQHVLNDAYFNSELYAQLAKLYKLKNNVPLAYQYLEKSKTLKDSIRARELNMKQMGLQIKYETSRKEKLIEQEKQRSSVAQQDAKKKTYQRNLLLLVLTFLIIIFAIITFSYSKIKKKNRQLSESNAALHKLAEQKHFLLKEVHHRVKNNLTMLKSLFYLQAKSSSNPDVREALDEAQQRIQSMALMHQNLYDENEHEKIAFTNFLKQLFGDLESFFTPDDKLIEIEYQGEDIELDISTALLLALILNELATNSFKYAFHEKERGQIRVSVEKMGNSLEINYADNGPGLTSGYIPDNGGLGFKLIRLLSEQIEAIVNYQNKNNWSQFTIKVPLK